MNYLKKEIKKTISPTIARGKKPSGTNFTKDVGELNPDPTTHQKDHPPTPREVYPRDEH